MAVAMVLTTKLVTLRTAVNDGARPFSMAKLPVWPPGKLITGKLSPGAGPNPLTTVRLKVPPSVALPVALICPNRPLLGRPPTCSLKIPLPVCVKLPATLSVLLLVRLPPEVSVAPANKLRLPAVLVKVPARGVKLAPAPLRTTLLLLVAIGPLKVKVKARRAPLRMFQLPPLSVVPDNCAT